MSTLYADQNLRLAAALLEKQGEINDLKKKISELELAHKTVEIALGHTSALAETLQKQRDEVLVMCREAAELSDGNCGIAVRTIEIFAGKEMT